MDIQSINMGTVVPKTELNPAADTIKKERAQFSKDNSAEHIPDGKEQNDIQPEELLQNIKKLTDEGLYSVRFELNENTNELVINLIEKKSGEIIRQIPPKEILDAHEFLSDLRGNIVETES